MLALLVQLEAACTATDDLAEAVEETFPQHPDAEVILSFPGLGIQLGARILAEIGDDRKRFADARGLKAYAGVSPITRGPRARSPASPADGSRTTASIMLATSGPSPRSPPHPAPKLTTGTAATAETGTPLPSATSSTEFNRMIGQLYHCLQQGHRYDEALAFPAPPDEVGAAAA